MAAEVEEDDLTSLLDALERGLNEAGLSSLVNQERASAVEGRVEELTTEDVVGLHRELSRRGSHRESRAKAGDVRIRPLRVGERLAELLDLLEVAVGGSFAIEAQLRDDVKAALDASGHTWDGQVLFAVPPEAVPSAASQRDWVLEDQQTLQRRGPAVRQTVLLINRLREQAELPRSEQLFSVASHDPGASADLVVPEEWA